MLCLSVKVITKAFVTHRILITYCDDSPWLRVCELVPGRSGRPRGSPVQYTFTCKAGNLVLYGRPSRSPWQSKSGKIETNGRDWFFPFLAKHQGRSVTSHMRHLYCYIRGDNVEARFIAPWIINNHIP